MKTRILAIILSGLVSALIGTFSYAQDTVKIGATYPLSGGVAEAASWGVEGIKMAVEEFNEQGGIQVGEKKLPIELILYDDKCDPTTGVSVVEKMINRDNVVAISGSYCSSVVLAQREVSNANKIVQLSPMAVNPKITSPGYPYTFRLCNTIDMYAEPFVDFVVKKLPEVKSVAFLAITDDYGRSAVKIYNKLFKEKGIKVLGTEYFKHGDTDLYTQITKIINMAPDAVYIVTDEDSQNIGALKQLKELGFKGQRFGCSTYGTDNMIKLGGKELLEGLYIEGPNFNLVKDNPDVKEWLKRYKEKFDREGNAFSLWGYQSIQILVNAIQKAGTISEKEKILKAMQETDLNDILGFYGKPHFDENGQTYPYLSVLQYQDGERVVVYSQGQ